MGVIFGGFSRTLHVMLTWPLLFCVCVLCCPHFRWADCLPSLAGFCPGRSSLISTCPLPLYLYEFLPVQCDLSHHLLCGPVLHTIWAFCSNVDGIALDRPKQPPFVEICGRKKAWDARQDDESPPPPRAGKLFFAQKSKTALIHLGPHGRTPPRAIFQNSIFGMLGTLNENRMKFCDCRHSRESHIAFFFCTADGHLISQPWKPISHFFGGGGSRPHQNLNLADIDKRTCWFLWGNQVTVVCFVLLEDIAVKFSNVFFCCNWIKNSCQDFFWENTPTIAFKSHWFAPHHFLWFSMKKSNTHTRTQLGCEHCWFWYWDAPDHMLMDVSTLKTCCKATLTWMNLVQCKVLTRSILAAWYDCNVNSYTAKNDSLQWCSRAKRHTQTIPRIL